MQKYARLEQIGQGAFGTVFKARHKDTGEIVAVKKVHIDSDEGVPAASLKEICSLKQLKHKNIVKLNDICLSDLQTDLFLMFEYCEQDLKKFLSSCDGKIDQGVVKKLMHQLLSGVAFCHGQDILHRDLKPQNLLVNKAGELKIADFGLSKTLNFLVASQQSTKVVTLWYRAPDVMLGNPFYSYSIDIWSVGCIFAELARAGQPLFPGQNEHEQIELIFKLLGTPTEKTWPGFSEWTADKTFPHYQAVAQWPQQVAPELPGAGQGLLHAMLRCNPNERIPADSALKHAYFADLEQ